MHVIILFCDGFDEIWPVLMNIPGVVLKCVDQLLKSNDEWQNRFGNEGQFVFLGQIEIQEGELERETFQDSREEKNWY